MKEVEKGYVIVIEEHRENTGYTTYVGDDVFTDEEKAVLEYKERVNAIRDDEYGDFFWLADAIRERPNDIKEVWAGNFYVTFTDKESDDSLTIYLHRPFIIRTPESAAERLRYAFGDYATDEEELPLYARCYIKFKDSDEVDARIFKLQDEYVDGEDDRIFFYCNGLSELIGLCDEYNPEDFYIVGLDEYFDDLNTYPYEQNDRLSNPS